MKNIYRFFAYLLAVTLAFSSYLPAYVYAAGIEDAAGIAEDEAADEATEPGSKNTDYVGGYIKPDLGYDIPIPEDTSGLLKAGDLPSKYNLMDKLPVIKDQNPYGTCWTFSSIGVMESDLIHDGRATADSVDLSELHLAYFGLHGCTDPKSGRKDMAGFPDSGPKFWLNNGGNAVIASRVFSNLIGAAKESDFPYPKKDDGLYTPDDSDGLSKNSVRLKNAYFLNIKDKEGIKAAIMEHNGVAVSYLETISNYKKTPNANEEYNDTHNAYYLSEKGFNDKAKNKEGHAIMLVGWDDDFSINYFNEDQRPSNNGAWLARNSWGGSSNDYSHNGYFWISYEDAGLNSDDEAVAMDVTTDLYDNCYSYDGQPHENYNLTYSGSNKHTASVTFDVKAGETVNAVGFEIGTANVTADITVTDKKTRESVSTSTDVTYAGIHSVDLPKGLDVSIDSEVELSITYTSNSGSNMIIVTEYDGNNGAVMIGNVPFYTKVDRGFCLDGEHMDFDPRMRIYTKNGSKYTPSTQGVTALELDKTTAVTDPGESLTLKCTIYPAEAADKSLTWTSSNDAVATVSDQGVVRAIAAGTSQITATAKSGITATCTVTVKEGKPGPEEPTGPVSIKNAKVTLKSNKYTYNGKVHKPVIKTISNLELKEGTDYTVKIRNSKGKTVKSPKDAGTYTLVITGKGNYTDSTKATYKIVKASNSLKVAAKKNTYDIDFSKLKKKKESIDGKNIYKFTKKNKTKGTIKYTLSSVKKGKKKIRKGFSVNKSNGKLTLSKGLGKGSYKVTIKITAGNKNYKEINKNVSFTVKVE